MNEKAVFFFSSDEKKKYSLEIEWMNGNVNFYRKKKNTQKTPKNVEKKKHTRLSKKIKKTHQILNECLMNFFWEKKNTPLYFFFFPLRGKKKYTILRFDWMNGPWTFSEKKNTIPLGRTVIKSVLQCSSYFVGI